MIIEELQTASRQLKESLDKYLDACITFSNRYDPGNTLDRSLQSLLDGITNELQLVDSYKSKLRKARAVINQIRNSTPAFLPISVLPTDVLVYIFQLVLRTHSCRVKGSRLSTSVLNYPDALSHVCSRWRRIALSAHNLWSHVDLSLSQPHLLARSKLFATRAGHSLLDIHTSHDLKHFEEYPEADVIDFCALIAPRMRSLQLLYPYYLVKHSQSILWSCFANCVPGTFTKLELYSKGPMNSDRFFEATESPTTPQSQALNLPHLEDVLLHITTLRLHRVYPYWTSKAYYGLVELRLSGGDLGNTITESQLVHIFISSPELRILHFSLKITDQLPENTLPTPISLRFLEVLSMSPMEYNHCQTLLRWITPGLNPVRVSLGSLARTSEPLFGEVFTWFNARSNISRLDLNTRNCPLSLHRLLGSLPKLRVLSLRGFALEEEKNESHDLDRQPPCRLPMLDAIHIRQCGIPLNELRWLTKVHSIHTITLLDCGLRIRPGESVSVTKDVVESHLSGIAPVVKVLTQEEALWI